MEQNDSTDESVKKARYRIILAVLIFAVGVAFLVWGLCQQGHDALNGISTAVMLGGFFSCNIVTILLLHRPEYHLVEAAFEEMNQTYDKKELTELLLTGKEELEERLLHMKFRRMEHGFYIKSGFSFWMDRIRCYARVIEDVDLVNAIRREAEHFDNMRKKRANFCLLFFIYLDRVGEYEKESVKNFGKNGIILEELLLQRSCSMIAIAVDEHTKTGYFLDIEKKKRMVLYSYGCEQIKKIAGVKDERKAGRI